MNFFRVFSKSIPLFFVGYFISTNLIGMTEDPCKSGTTGVWCYGNSDIPSCYNPKQYKCSGVGENGKCGVADSGCELNGTKTVCKCSNE